MTISIDELNTLPDEEATDLFRSCCGASAWVSQMVKRRPFKSGDQLLQTADRVWTDASLGQQREAFDHHPRIGEKESATPQSDRAREFSEREQSQIRLASSSAFDQMTLVNQAYEKKFGHIYIVSAAGKSAHELLDIARQRIRNDPDTELRVAAEEQRKITRLRLQKLIGDEPG